MSILNRLKEDLKVIFKCLEICAIKGRGGDGRRLMAKTILNFHFDYLKPSLSIIVNKKE